MKLSEDLAWRGLIKDKTFADNSWLDNPKTFYLGVDAASEDSLTIGNLAIFMLARRLLDAGWKTILLTGGATSLIGDPGGKTTERELKSREQVKSNIEAVKAQVANLFDGQDFSPVDNIEWLTDVKFLDFLRDVGKAFPMSELMQREFVTERLKTGISYAEFSYSLIQGYDYWQLYKNHGVELQIGGSDQWGNMLSGVALIRKKESKEVHAMSMPLVINKETGQKFGKSESGAVWLDPSKTSPQEFYQFWINTPDSDVENFLKVFTPFDKAEVEEVMKLHTQNPSKRSAQRRLADTVTLIVHGEDGKELAQQHAKLITTTSTEDAKPTILNQGISLVDALVQTGLASSNSDARRVIDEGGVYLNNQPYAEETLKSEEPAILRRGKKLSNSALIEIR